MQDDPILARIGEGIARHTTGDVAGARALLTRLWDEVGARGDPLHRLAIAHALADCMRDPAEVLRWDQRALDAADEVTDDAVRRAGIAVSRAAFYPSLHLNLGEAHRRVGDLERATEHVARGRAALAHLAGDGSLELLADALDRLAARIARVRATSEPRPGLRRGE